MSGRVVVPVPPPRSPTSESSLVIVVSVLGVVILLVFAPIVVIIIVLSKGRCAASELKKELDYTRYSLVPRPSSLVGKNKGEEGLVKLIT